MKRPNLLIYICLGFLLKIFALFKPHRITKKIRIKGPAIVLSNHTSFFDFVYTTVALYPRRVTYLAAHKMFYEPDKKMFLRLARAIPKALMQSDPVASLKAFRILKQNGIIGIFPEGQISPSGTSLVPAYSIAKFVKKANVDLYIVKHKNAYFANPPWSKKTFKGLVETEMSLLISKQELETASLDTIYTKIKDGLYFSSSAYNEEKRYTYKLNDITNLENGIYQCPVCLHEGLSSHHDRLICPKCQHEMIYDQYGMLNGKTIEHWFKKQEKHLQDTIDQTPDFTLETNVRLQSYQDKHLIDVGSGILTLDHEAYRYIGTMHNQIISKTFRVEYIQSLPSDIGRNIQIYESYLIYQFDMDNPYLPTKFVHAGEYLYQKKHLKK